MAGVDPRESWDYTWGEGVEIVNAFNQRENDRAKKRAVALYNAAVFLAQTVTGKQVASFEQAFPGFGATGRKQEEMSDDAMYAVVHALNAQFGGEEVD